jgi:hypothetical protein
MNDNNLGVSINFYSLNHGSIAPVGTYHGLAVFYNQRHFDILNNGVNEITDAGRVVVSYIFGRQSVLKNKYTISYGFQSGFVSPMWNANIDSGYLIRPFISLGYLP